MRTLLEKQIAIFKITWPTVTTHLKARDWKALGYVSRKIGWKIWNLLLFPLGLMLVIVIRAIRPWVLVRINILVSERIGHLAGNTELYLCERDAGINVPQGPYYDIWYHNWPVSNQQLAKMWNRILNVWPSWLMSSVKTVNSLIPGGEIHQISRNSQTDIDVHNLIDMFPVHLQFTIDEEARGSSELQSLGVPEGSKFVCLIVRDSSYLKQSVPWRSWDYHNYRDCDIQNYALAAKKLVERGYYVVRMGAVVEKKMNIENPMIIDYATNGMRSDFLDIYLAAKCEFCVVGNAGFEAVPYVFRRPIVYIDHMPLGMIRTDSKRLLSTTKKHWLRSENRFMTFREILQSDIGFSWYTSLYEDMGVELVESSPEEIAAACIEMDERLRGAWKASEEDDELQSRFWKIFPKTEYHGEIRSFIGAEFLRKHKAWLN